MRLLDLFCGAGGAAVGYARAGFDEIVGVDIKPQPRYPFQFVQADALEFCRSFGAAFDAIHASPPCQAYSALRTMPRAKADHPDLVEPTRHMLATVGRPSVIENVEGSPLRRAIRLCGTMFGLHSKDGLSDLRRHRLFELSWEWGMLLPPCNHDGIGSTIHAYGGGARRKRPRTIGVYGESGGSSTRSNVQQYGIADSRHAMGIDWMNRDELGQAIPPAYTEFIGHQLLTYLEEGRT